MERPENSEMDNESEPVKIIKVRPDLEEFFEVVSHQERTLRCKLAGKDSCKMNGVTGTLKFCAQRGWFNLERHVTRTHKIPKDMFTKTGSSVKLNAEGNRRKTQEHKDQKNQNDSSAAITTGVFIADAGSCSSETKWKNLLTKERYCVICLSACFADGSEYMSEEDHCDQLKRLFPGCEGSAKLSKQLFFVFFLRNIAAFPAEKCEELLKKCRGQRMPETWFSLCSTCRENVLEAAEVNEEIIRLQNRWCKLKTVLKSKFQENSNSAVNLSRIEEEIRRHIFVYETRGATSTLSSFSDSPSDNCFNDCDDPVDLFDEELTALKIKVENENKHEEKTHTTTYPRPRRKLSQRNYKELIDYIDDSDEGRYTGVTTTDSMSQDAPAVIKIEQDFKGDSEVLNTEKDTLDTLTSNQDNYELISHVGNEDDDYEVDPMELSEAESDGSNFSLKRSSSKHKSASTQKKSKTNVESCQESPSNRNPGKLCSKKTKKSGAELNCCQFCPSKYKSYRSLQEHLEAHEISKTQDNKYDCQQCGYPCHSEKARTGHSKIKHCREGEFPCTLCDYLAVTRKQLNVHMQEHREEAQRERVDEKYFCKLCNRLFITYEVLCRHKRISHYEEIGITPHQCEHCSLILSSKRLLKDHIQQTHKKQSRFFCELCGKGMLYMSKLRRHMNGHLKEKSFVCEICGADFQYNETLKQHIKKEHSEALAASLQKGHSTLNSKKACRHCGMEFTSSSLLTRHVKSHAELFANKCDLCGKGYVTHQSLRRHKEINHTQREVPCTFCGKKFPHQEYIRGHYRFCKKYPDRRQPNALSGEPLQSVCIDAQDDRASEDARNILEAAIASSCLDTETTTKTPPTEKSIQENDLEYQSIKTEQALILPAASNSVSEYPVIIVEQTQMNIIAVNNDHMDQVQ